MDAAKGSAAATMTTIVVRGVGRREQVISDEISHQHIARRSRVRKARNYEPPPHMTSMQGKKVDFYIGLVSYGL